jgi:hypothetical protein
VQIRLQIDYLRHNPRWFWHLALPASANPALTRLYGAAEAGIDAALEDSGRARAIVTLEAGISSPLVALTK